MRSTPRRILWPLSIALGFTTGAEPFAQLDNDQARVVIGHYHLNVTSIDEHLRFWTDTLGGRPVSLGADAPAAVRFPGVLLMFTEQVPSGPTRGTTFDHIGFAVPDVPALAARAVENGYARTLGREPAPGQDADLPEAGVYSQFEYLVGPDGVKVELVTASEDGAPAIAHHHVHFVNRDFVEMQRWYIRTFHATPRDVLTDFYAGAELPGVGYSLNFFSWLPAEDLQGTAGRAVDHVGFEVSDLESFCAELEASGVRFLEPYRKATPVSTARIVDPWGTVIELTEGLRDIYRTD